MKRITILLAFFMFAGFALHAQTVQITGSVTSAEDGSLLPGVSVVVQGTTIGTTTNANGSYVLNVPTTATTLVYSFIGFQTMEVEIANRTVINVVLEVDILGLDEVVVTAYGQQTRRSLTGAQTAVTGEQLQKIQVSDITRALEGTVAGLQTTTSTGQPGSGSSIRIRGQGSLSASSSPLFVVDGMPYEGNINNLPQGDIESMTVLKDASATALYGARAANGVVLITTKRGTSSKPLVNIDSRVGVNSRAYKDYDLMSEPAEYYEMFWESMRNERFYGAGFSWLEAGHYASERIIKYTDPATSAVSWMLGYNNYDVPDNKLIDPFTGKLNPDAKLLYQDRWVDEIFENQIRQEHSASVSGVNEGTNYFLSFNYLDDKGYSPNSGFERYSSRFRVAQDVSKWLKVGTNLAYIKTDILNPISTGPSSANIFYVANVVAPIYPIYQRNPDGTLALDNQGNKQYDFGVRPDMIRPVMNMANPAGTQILNTEQTASDRVNVNANAEISFTRDLKLILNFGFDNVQRNRLSVYNNQIGQFAAIGGSIYKSSGLNRTITANQLLSYNKVFGEHSLSLLGGHELYKWDYSFNYGTKQNFLFPSIKELDWAVVMSNVGSYGYDYALESYFANANYGFRQKYYLDASIRQDGSSRFHPDNRWGTFWAAGASWILSQESFLEGITPIDLLKVRLSYGSVGNDNLSGRVGDADFGTGYYYYAYEDQYDVVNNDGEVGLQFAFKGNPNLKWESNKSLTFGLDFGFMDRFSGNIDYFRRTSSDLLFILPQAPSTGISEIPFNLGELDNNGIELELRTDIIKRSDFNFSLSLNATRYSTTITELPDIYKEDGLIRGGYQKWVEGKSPYAFFMRKFDGVDPVTGRGLWLRDVTTVEEIEGEEVETTVIETTDDWTLATRYLLDKDATPDLFGGVALFFDYKGFDLSIQTAYQIGGWVYDGIYATFMHAAASNDYGNNWHKDIYRRWTPQNTDTDVPILDQYLNTNNVSDRFLVKGDYFSLRNIVLGYTLPNRMTSTIGIERLRVYAVADNIFFMSRRQGFDPRMYFSGVTTASDMNYSPIKTMSVGASIVF